MNDQSWRRHFWIGGVVGPVTFVSAWVIGGAISADYSPTDDAISELAAVGASTRWLMTAGFIAFGIGVPLFAQSLRRAVAGPSWIAATIAGLATLGVAATPLDWSAAVDDLHGVFAGTGYVALALTPALAAAALRPSHRKLAFVSAVVAGISALCLALTLTGEQHGLWQRLGLTLVDAWIVAAAIGVARRHRV
jgi:hypothetical membrane protein